MLKVAYRAGVHIGEPAAEDDDLLLRGCFVEMAAYDQLVDMETSKCILLGRTGSGKSALFRYIEQQQDRTIRIDPMEFAFDYIANSNVISFVVEMGCDLHVLFEYLWKHVLLCKAVKCYFDNRSAFESIVDRFSGRTDAEIYFRKCKDTFWVSQAERMREVSESFESSLNSELRGVVGTDFAKIEAGMGSSLKFTDDQKRQIEFRVKKAVSDIQIRELQSAIASVDEMFGLNSQRHHFILVDDLDSDWSETRLKYQLIRSLMESIKHFRKVRKVKVLVSLRSDVYEKSIFSIRGEGYQPEKYKGMLAQIRWSEDGLKRVLDLRVNQVFKSVYTKSNVATSDVLPPKMRKGDATHYILERTLFRPRDAIAFFNEILDQAAGSSEVTEKRVSLAEGDYSKNRYEALIREWSSVHPNCGVYLRVLQGRTGRFSHSDLATKEIVDDLCLELEEHVGDRQRLDPVEDACRLYSKRQTDQRRNAVITHLLSTLYKMGAISLKPAKGDHFRVCYLNEPDIIAEQITTDAAGEVVPMLWRTLGITPNIG